jgi:hypothetical protein
MVAAWRAQPRRTAGREPTPSAACSARHAVQTPERGGAERGDAGGTQGPGRQRQLLVDTLGWVRVVLSPRAGGDDGVAAPQRLPRRDPNEFPRLETLCADHPYHHQALHTGMTEHRPLRRIAVKTRPEGANGCTPLAKRWVVARTNAWPGRSRRHRTDDARPPESRGAMIYLRTIHLMRRRLTSHGRPEGHYRRVTAASLTCVS